MATNWIKLTVKTNSEALGLLLPCLNHCKSFIDLNDEDIFVSVVFDGERRLGEILCKTDDIICIDTKSIGHHTRNYLGGYSVIDIAYL
jgi:hypothetical protein